MTFHIDQYFIIVPMCVSVVGVGVRRRRAGMSGKRVFNKKVHQHRNGTIKRYNALDNREPVQTHGGTNTVPTLTYFRTHENK